MQIPVMNGIYTNEASDFRTSYPVNLIPVPKQQGISNGYLRPADGVDLFVTGLNGIDRGGINWNGICYRVCGTKLIKVGSDGVITTIGDVGSGGYCSFDYGFDYLAIKSGVSLYLYNGSALSQVTDPDLGDVNDVLWVDGYFMTTDGTYIVVTELNNPFSVNPLKYGSAEVDPDPIVAIKKIRNEVYAVGRYTIEVFDDVGGDLFPFARIDGATIPKGSIGTYTCCKFMDALAFVGGTKNEPVAIWLGVSPTSTKISTREIDQILHSYSEQTLSDCLLEPRIQDGHQWLYFHLPDQTLVYDYGGSNEAGSPIWFILKTNGKYSARNHVWCYDKWIVGHPTLPKLGVTTNKHGYMWGDVVDWEFNTSILYNNSNGAIFNALELVCLTGHVDISKNPTIYTQYSNDGELWSQPKFIKSGATGNRAKRLVWFQQGLMRNWRIQKFCGNSDSRLTIARLEADIEPLTV